MMEFYFQIVKHLDVIILSVTALFTLTVILLGVIDP